MQVKHDGQWIRRLSALSKLYFTPTFLGAEYIDASRPAMYVGNHSMYGIFDSPMLIDYLYNEHKVAVVSIADHSHFYVPLWREAVKKVWGSRWHPALCTCCDAAGLLHSGVSGRWARST